MSVRHGREALIDPKQMPAASPPATAVVERLADAASQRLGIPGSLARRLAEDFLAGPHQVSEERFLSWIGA